MLQTVATLISLLLAAGAVAIIATTIADDWEAMLSALGVSPAATTAPSLPQVRARMARRARLVRVRPLAASLRAAA